jgi:hypothetical protein
MMGLVLLLTLRLDAARVAMAFEDSESGMMEVHMGRLSRALGASLSEPLLGVVPRYDPRACAWLAGSLHAAVLHEELRESFDEDWFDNPRAQEYVTDVGGFERLVLDEAEVHRGIGLLSAELGELLG